MGERETANSTTGCAGTDLGILRGRYLGGAFALNCLGRSVIEAVCILMPSSFFFFLFIAFCFFAFCMNIWFNLHMSSSNVIPPYPK